MSALRQKVVIHGFNLNQKIDELFAELIHKPWGGKVDRLGWQPAVDLYVTDAMFVLEADLPGVRRENIELTLDGNILQISGHREGVLLVRSAECVALERAQGEFVRQFQLTAPVDFTRLETYFDNGLFRAIIPKLSIEKISDSKSGRSAES